VSQIKSATYRVKCACGATAVAKGKGIDPRCGTSVVNEWICWRLIKLLATKGCEHVTAIDASFSFSPIRAQRYGRTMQTGPWYQTSIILEDLGKHQRLHPGEVPGAIFPGWIYWFDRWVGRLDGPGDTNLLLLPSGVVATVDWDQVFPWSMGYAPPFARRPDAMDVACDPRVHAASTESARAAIKSITDGEIWQIVLNPAIPPECADMGRLVSFWSGLVLRRDLL
jgi:hypothetical protein